MDSTSKAQVATPSGSPIDEENPPTTKASPMVALEEEESETQNDSDPIPAGSDPLEEVLSRPTLDSWYESGSLFPSIPANMWLPPVGWEWLVRKEDAIAVAIWIPPFQEILDLKI